jgi:hypothetical protein
MHAVKHSQCLRSTLSHAFCQLIAAMDDISVHVSQRATLYLGTIHDRAIQSLIYCLECQFSSLAEDRPAILKARDGTECFSWILNKKNKDQEISVPDPDPGSGAFLTPESGIQDG